MVITAGVYGQLFGKVFNEEVDVLSDALKMMATTVTYTPNQDTDDYKDDVTNEVTGTGYTAGGATLAGVTFAYTAGTNTWALDCDPVVWDATGGALTVRHLVVYDDTPAGDGAKPLICFQSSDADITATNAELTFTPNAAGIMTITVAAP